MQGARAAVGRLALRARLAAAHGGRSALELLRAAAAVARAAPAVLNEGARGRLRLVHAAPQRPHRILSGHRPEACMEVRSSSDHVCSSCDGLNAERCPCCSAEASPRPPRTPPGSCMDPEAAHIMNVAAVAASMPKVSAHAADLAAAYVLRVIALERIWC